MKKFFLGLLFIFTSFTSSAGLITHNGYTLNEDTNVISGKGMEWLQWDVTFLTSIDVALSLYGADGWKLASNQQMSELFNSFGLASHNLWDADENTSQFLTSPFERGEDITIDPELQFLSLFGFTRGLTEGWWDLQKETSAIFGNDLDADGLYNIASVTDDYELAPFMRQKTNSVSLRSDVFTNKQYGGFGIALVRTTSVPEPTTLAIFALGMLGLASRKFNKRIL
ncbi:MAG: PEP-CTERM sorting domain-containing protein [Colwellia sp.]|nr:PEP-CTERM sorting domain-containing protein [Colwellia sp.]MCW8864502.1 PEP-CTERM sorting domain-containing protein [Colwellia sp.]MCW9082262.1 PEP-CTERM sorting domain-containing protein [Colwellia sp.]